MTSADVTFTATFKSNGQTVKTISVTDYLTMPDAPINSGYIFQGWTDGVNVIEPGNTVQLIGDTIFTAVWEKALAYTVTCINRGIVEAEVQVTGSIFTPGIPYHPFSNWTFKGWERSDTKEILPANSWFEVTSDITLTAVWENN